MEVILANAREAVVISLVPLTFLAVSPWNNLDGNNPAKFFVIVSLSAIVISLSLIEIYETLKSRVHNLFLVATATAIVWTLFSLYVNRYSIDERLFGIYGRSLGAITFISLFTLLALFAISNFRNVKFFNFGLLISLVFVAGYFALQLIGLDPAAWEDAYGGIPSSTLGNPNFVSSSLAILSAPLLALILYRTRLGVLLQISIIPILGIICFLIWRTQSIQGLIIFLIAFVALLVIRLNDFSSNRFGRVLQAILLASGAAIPAITLAVALGFVPYVGGATLIARSEYWRAAWSLIIQNPLFGKGFDSFGDWYLFYRDQAAIDRSPNLFTDSTHNLILELGVFGGFPLLLIYLALQAFALRSALQIINSAGNLQVKVVIVTWIGFNLQSAISPSSLALITLGFVTTGLVYGAGQALTNQTPFESRPEHSKGKKYRFGFGARVLTMGLAMVIIGTSVYISTLPIVKDARFRDAIEQGDGQKLIEVSLQHPFNYQLARQAAMTLKSNGYDALAMDMVGELIDNNPNNIQGWRMLFEYSSSTADRNRALSKMRELDPLNPELAKLIP